MKRFLRGRSPSAASDRARILVRLAQERCPFCLEEQEGVQRYFSWFAIENYAEPEILFRLHRAQGFCPRHTRLLLALASPAVVASVFQFLFQAMRRQPVRRGRPQGAPDLGGAPELPCPACACEAEHRGFVWGSLSRTLHEAEIRAGLARAGVCAFHLAVLSPPPDALQWAALAEAAYQAGSAVREGRQPGEVAWGLPGEDPLPDLPAPEVFFDLPGDGSRAAGNGTPVLRALEQQLRRAPCLVCRLQQGLLARYLSWLAGEILRHPESVPYEAVRMCREHWGMFRRLQPEAAHFLGTTADRYWIGRLEKGKQRRSGPVPPGEREAPLQPGPCPVCAVLEGAAERTCALLAGVLPDAGVQRAYRRGGGLCLPHLPLLLRALQADPEGARFVLEVARVQVEALSWALEEYLRKRSWSERYDVPGVEQHAWRDAVAYYSGLAALPAGFSTRPHRPAGG